MNQPISNICPLRAIAGIGCYDDPAVCVGDRCAWWNHPGCVLFGVAEELASIASSLDDLVKLAGKSQALSILEKKTAPSAANTESGRVEQNLTGPVSTSTITENGGNVK